MQLESINYHFLSGNISSEPFNERESAENLKTLIEEALREDYPGVKICITYTVASGVAYSEGIDLEFDNHVEPWDREYLNVESDIQDTIDEILNLKQWYVSEVETC